MAPGLLLAAPASGSGKTTVVLALLRHFRNAGHPVGAVKVGPDYIDPAFHQAAAGRPCLNIDTWAMPAPLVGQMVERAGAGVEAILGEGVMGLFDGAPDGRGSTADLARMTGWPVVLIVDARGMAASAGAVVRGFAAHDPAIQLAGVIFNRIGGPDHQAALEAACEPLGVPVLGGIARSPELVLPDRHLGLVQADEHPDLEAFLDRAAEFVASAIDCNCLLDLARPASLTVGDTPCSVPPIGQRIAVADDLVFSFAYPAMIEAWREAGASVTRFSPLADQAPDEGADAVYLPGGYPELHAARLAANTAFLTGLRAAASRGAAVYGECGGYMVLGRTLRDGTGRAHPMAGLLPLETSFAEPRLTLGYRDVRRLTDGARFRGHEFHYATITNEADGPALFDVTDARGRRRGPAGRCQGSVSGSFIHLIA